MRGTLVCLLRVLGLFIVEVICFCGTECPNTVCGSRWNEGDAPKVQKEVKTDTDQRSLQSGSSKPRSIDVKTRGRRGKTCELTSMAQV